MQEQERQEEEAHDEFAEFPLPWRSEKDRVLAADEWQVAICCGYSVAETIAKLANATASVPVSGSDSTVFPTEAQVEAVARTLFAADYAGHFDEARYTRETALSRFYHRNAENALAAVAPLVNGIADQRDAARAEVERLRGEWQRDTATGWESTKQERRSLALAFGMDPEEALQLDFVACAHSLRSELGRAKNGARWLSERLESAVKREEAVRAELAAAREFAEETIEERDEARAVNADWRRARDTAVQNESAMRRELASLREELAEARKDLTDMLGKASHWEQKYIDTTEQAANKVRELEARGSLPDDAEAQLRIAMRPNWHSMSEQEREQSLRDSRIAFNLVRSWLSPVVPAAAEEPKNFCDCCEKQITGRLFYGEDAQVCESCVESLRAAAVPVEPPAASEAAKMLEEFHVGFGYGRDPDSMALRRKLTAQEAQELLDAFDSGNMWDIAHELADVVYVCYGSAWSMNIDLDAALRAVHKANMTKIGPDGPVFDADGKVQKGPHYRAPDMSEALGGRPQKCPRCDSFSPSMHPAMNYGGEVQVCPHVWHEGRPAAPGVAPTAADFERGICSCGNRFDGDNLCMESACEQEGVQATPSLGEPKFAVGDRVLRCHADGEVFGEATVRKVLDRDVGLGRMYHVQQDGVEEYHNLAHENRLRPAPPVVGEGAETEQRCMSCQGEVQYQMGSGGREYYCPACEDTFPYDEGKAPRRVQLLADGQYDELRAEMHEHLDDLTAPSVSPTEEKS